MKKLVGNLEENKLLGTCRRCVYNNMSLKPVVCESVEWILLVNVRDQWWTVINVVNKLWVSKNPGNVFKSWKTVRYMNCTLVITITVL